ncbi:MAG: cell division protein ZapA [bacterium]|nr:cell division protein ZapA [bacterium]MCX7916797.1 cell division protein ZapA [bacterium]MDW8163346.1 cell division protein ZapA [Candidatus Omnitrophota bacterium]
MYKVNILGKTYTLHSSLPYEELTKVIKEINDRFNKIQSEYKTLDKVDVLVFYLIELYENIYLLKKECSYMEKNKEKIKNKIDEIEKEITITLKNLTI